MSRLSRQLDCAPLSRRFVLPGRAVRCLLHTGPTGDYRDDRRRHHGGHHIGNRRMADGRPRRGADVRLRPGAGTAAWPSPRGGPVSHEAEPRAKRAPDSPGRRDPPASDYGSEGWASASAQAVPAPNRQNQCDVALSAVRRGKLPGQRRPYRALMLRSLNSLSFHFCSIVATLRASGASSSRVRDRRRTSASRRWIRSVSVSAASRLDGVALSNCSCTKAISVCQSSWLLPDACPIL
ncbi:hypothetical protein APR11_004811 [Nocardia amikacinitolerans]|nr:hypothetical protein [Nocardia amikacinitolerans]